MFKKILKVIEYLTIAIILVLSIFCEIYKNDIDDIQKVNMEELNEIAKSENPAKLPIYLEKLEKVEISGILDHYSSDTNALWIKYDNYPNIKFCIYLSDEDLYSTDIGNFIIVEGHLSTIDDYDIRKSGDNVTSIFVGSYYNKAELIEAHSLY